MTESARALGSTAGVGCFSTLCGALGDCLSYSAWLVSCFSIVLFARRVLEKVIRCENV